MDIKFRMINSMQVLSYDYKKWYSANEMWNLLKNTLYDPLNLTIVYFVSYCLLSRDKKWDKKFLILQNIVYPSISFQLSNDTKVKKSIMNLSYFSILWWFSFNIAHGR